MAENRIENNSLIVISIVAIVAIVGVFLYMSSLNNNGLNRDSAGKAYSSLTNTGAARTWQVNGNHYNLNIIGARNVGDIGDSMGHTLFVQLNGKTKIMMTQDPLGEFQVTDRNGLDGSASFNIAPGKYNIYARALGKPGGKASIDAWGEFEDAVDGTQLVLLGYVNIEREKGRSSALNINKLFYVDVTLCTEIDQDTGECIKTVEYTDYWVFDIEELLSYWWDYTNSGLKLLQVRLYGCTLDSTGTASDYCRWGDGSPIVSTKTVISS